MVETNILDETFADAVVEKILRRKEAEVFMHVFKEGDQVFLVTEFEQITREEIQKAVDEARENLTRVERALAEFDALSAPVEPQAEPTPEPQPQDQPQEAQEQPQDQNPQPEQMTELPVVPEIQ